MRFDPVSFLLGALAAAVVALLTWRARRRLSNIQESASTQIEGTRRFVGRTSHARYQHDLARYLQRRHLAGSLFPLAEVLLEPRVISGPGPVMPLGSDETPRSVFDGIPRFHDMPQSYAQYNFETLTLDDLGAGDRHIALLGLCGMGKSTALVTLALMALGEVKFETLEDLSQQAIRDEEKALSRQDRERRAKEREQIQARALERLHDAHQKEREKLHEVTQEERLPPLDLTTLLPVFVHLNDLELDPALYGKPGPLDPAEPLVRAVQRYVSGLTAQVAGSAIYPALEAGRALVLVDGYDELSNAAREPYFHWLRQFLGVYGHNMIVVAGPVEGYEPLVTLGFVPAFLRPWRDEDFRLLAQRWATAWTADKGKKAALPDDQAMRRLTADNRGRSILDVTLKLWTGLAGDARDTGRASWYDALVNRLLSQAERRALLPGLAVALVEAGQPVSETALREALAAPVEGEESGRKVSVPGDLLRGLVQDGLLLAYPGDRYSFRHPQIAAYLASERLIEQGAERATEVALDPAWYDALGFAAARLNMLPAIYRKLSTTPDLLYTNLFGLVRWLPDAPGDAPWRGDVFKRLAAAMMVPEQYPTVRARAMAALVASRDKNVLFVLRQALRSVDPDIQRLGCIGLGALGDPEAIKDLMPLLDNPSREVQLAAGLALGAIGTERAMEMMVQGLLHGSEDLRRAVAEALAAIPDEGHAVLRDAIRAEDILVRRAAVYGLSRVKAPWALVSLYRAMLEDEQWIVRSAAEDAFMEAQSPERNGPRAHPEADTLGWLIEWAADRGEGVPKGVHARQVLIRALQEGQTGYRVMAAQTLGRLGHVQALKPLYSALRDRHPEVREAAYSALAELEMRLGEPLPGVA